MVEFHRLDIQHFEETIVAQYLFSISGESLHLFGDIQSNSASARKKDSWPSLYNYILPLHSTIINPLVQGTQC